MRAPEGVSDVQRLDIYRCYDESGADVSALGLGCAEKQVGHPYLSPLNAGGRAKRLTL